MTTFLLANRRIGKVIGHIAPAVAEKDSQSSCMQSHAIAPCAVAGNTNHNNAVDSGVQLSNATPADDVATGSPRMLPCAGSVPSSSSTPLSFGFPDHLRDLRARVLRFVEDRVYPLETIDAQSDPGALAAGIARLQAEAKAQGLWALGHPKALGGGGMPFMDYVFINEVQGRSELALVCLGTHSLQDSLMLHKHASPAQRDRYLRPLVTAEIYPSFAMTEPDVASSDPLGIRTTAWLDARTNEWVVNGRKWWTTGAATAAYTTVMCRTGGVTGPVTNWARAPLPAAGIDGFSMILVPTDTPGYDIEGNTHVLGTHGVPHNVVRFDQCRVPASNLLGPRGMGFIIAQERLGPGRIFHCMRWLGQAQRAFDLMCRRLNTRRIRGGKPLGTKQLMQQHVFDSYSEIQAARLLTLNAAAALDRGDPARVEIGAIKVFGARMLSNVIDRAVQVHGALGLTARTPLGSMLRHARAAHFYDGPDEIHISTVGRLVLREYRKQEDMGKATWDFALRS